MNSNHQDIEVNEAVLMAYINTELSEKDAEQVDKWLSADPKNKAIFNKLNKTWEATGNLVPNPVAVDTNAAWQKVKDKIDTTSVIPITKTGNTYLKLAFGIAASIAIIFTVFNIGDKPADTIAYMASNTVLEKTLTDGSAITINKNSEISFLDNFGETNRKVKLEGNAFFDIARDTTLPFTVELPQSSYVKVLGTSFTINTQDKNNTTTVFVNTGRVEFGDASNKLILKPNEKGVYDHKSKAFTKVNVKDQKTEELYWINQQLQFEGEKLNDIIEVLSNIFDAEIKLDCQQAANYPIVSNHQQESLDEILEVMSLVHNLTIKKQTESGKVKYIITCND